MKKLFVGIFMEKSDYVIPVTKKKGIVRNIKEKVLNLFL